MATSFVSICLRRFGFSEIEQPFRCMFYVSNSVSNFIHNFAFKFIKKIKNKKIKNKKTKKTKQKTNVTSGTRILIPVFILVFTV